MTPIKLPIFIIFFFLTLSFSQLHINISQTTIEKNNLWTRILLAVDGGKKPYSFLYTSLPIGWKQVQKHIYFPQETYQRSGHYPCKVIIQDFDKN